MRLPRNIIVAAFSLVVFNAACGDTDERRTLTGPSSLTAVGVSPTPAADLPGVADLGNAGWNYGRAINFPGREAAYDFRLQLEQKYRDELRRASVTSFVDIEGTIVWTQEYLRYRLNGCSHTRGSELVLGQIDGAAPLESCGPSSTQFPPRNEPFAFRQQLEIKYRDGLRRPPGTTFVDPEGDIVWTQEYLRYRVSGCAHAESLARVFQQIDGRGIARDCADRTPAVPVRLMYLIPPDRPVRADYALALQRAFENLQAWYTTQLGGATFDLFASQPDTCALPQPAAFYGVDPWGKVSADARRCGPVQTGGAQFVWVLYADVVHSCNAPGRLGAGTLGLTIMGREDFEGLIGNQPTNDCGFTDRSQPGRYTGGAGHELGHAFGLQHPPGCDGGLASCDANALMWSGYSRYPNTYLRDEEKALLRASRFIR